MKTIEITPEETAALAAAKLAVEAIAQRWKDINGGQWKNEVSIIMATIDDGNPNRDAPRVSWTVHPRFHCRKKGQGNSLSEALDEMHATTSDITDFGPACRCQTSPGCSVKSEETNHQNTMPEQDPTQAFLDQEAARRHAAFLEGRTVQPDYYKPQQPTALAPHMQRVVDEKVQLDERLTKLNIFVGENPLFRQCSEAEQLRLVTQAQIMAEYSKILGERIMAFPH